MIEKSILQDLYIEKGKSMKEISEILDCSRNKVTYWMKKYEIERRSISEAVYVKNNPDGDPFDFKYPSNMEEAILYGLGIGLYWGEGTKASNNAVRLGNSDPALILSFVKFLEEVWSVKREDISFGLQLFSDMDPEKALKFWIKALGVSRKQFHDKVVVNPSRGPGSYRRKIKHGVVTIYFNNTKLRKRLGEELEKFKKVL